MNRYIPLLLLFLPLFARAQSTDAEFAPLLKERKIAEVEKLANEHIALNANDDVAIWHLANVVANDAVKRELVIAKAEACTKALPNSAKAASMAAQAKVLAASVAPKGCDTPTLKTVVSKLAPQTLELSAMVTAKADDAALKAALKALHGQFEVLEMGCKPAK